jgi:hypothetical protein
VNIDVVVHHHEVFGENHLAHAPEAVHRVGFADAHEDEVVETPSAGCAMSTISGKFIIKMGRKSFTDAPPM